jgi:hypothetical protein
MKCTGKSSLSEFLGEFVVYRNLVPSDPRLPGLEKLASQAGLERKEIPRKHEPGYAQVVALMLKEARSLVSGGQEFERLVYIGDTRMSDVTAFENLCRAGGWSGHVFICAETGTPRALECLSLEDGRSLNLANRWDLLVDFERSCTGRGCVIDSRTAVVFDLDKTALGGRGRNDRVIDRARLLAVQKTVSGLLGSAFDPAAFRQAYDELNRSEFHPFTADNQDYLAYICLVLGSGLVERTTLIDRVRSGQLSDFVQFIDEVEQRSGELPEGLARIHCSVYDRVKVGDPTPFKEFRRNEYLETVGRMGYLEDSTPVDELLKEEILITGEVRRAALEWQARGALLFGLSDKPDEAALPSPELAKKGFMPLHRTITHNVEE